MNVTKNKAYRIVLAGPLVFITAIAVMAGAAVWLPPGEAQVNNIAIPLVLFPAIWAGLFFYSCLERSLKRAFWVVGVLLLTQVGLIVMNILFTGSGR